MREVVKDRDTHRERNPQAIEEHQNCELPLLAKTERAA